MQTEVGKINFANIFSTFDADKDGTISLDEVHELPYVTLSTLFPNWQYETEESDDVEQDRDEL